MSIFLSPIRTNGQLLLTVCLYIGLYLVLQALLPNEKKFLEQLVVVLFIVLVARQVFDAFVIMQQLIGLFQHFFIVLMPILTAMLYAVQAIFLVIAWHPLLLVFIQFLLWIARYAVLPMLVSAVILDCCTRLLPAISFAKASDFLRQTVLSVIAVSVFTLTAALTFTGAVFFQLSEAVKSPIKKLIEQNIPLVGNLIVEGLSLFQKSQSVVASLTGLAFLTAAWAAAFYPAVTLLVHALTFKLLGAVTEPLTNARLSGLFDDMAKTLFVLCAVAILLGFILVFIVMLGLVILQFGVKRG